MDSKIYWSAALALTAIFSFASVSAQAQSVMVSAESTIVTGELVPLDGVWEFPGCAEPDAEDPPEEQFDQREFLVFDGNTVESRVILYSSTNGSCTGSEIVESEFFPFSSNGELQSLGWAEIDDFGNVVPLPVPPPRQDSSGPLDILPTVTELQFDLGVDGFEIGYYYMDDSGDSWYLYRNEGEDDAPTLYMSPHEPLRKVDVVFEPVPECEIELTQEVYVDGDTIMADVFRLSNPTSERLAIEIKVWMQRPDESVKSIVNIGAYGFFRLWPETELDRSPLWLGRVKPRMERGVYEVGCRLLNPKTGALIAEDLTSFEVQ